MEIKLQLRNEIKKWDKKLKERIQKIETLNKNGEDILRNALAYSKDSKYFFEKNDLVRSFEALLWAWTHIDIGLKYNFLKE